MTNLEKELNELKEQMLEMMHLVGNQLIKSKKAFAKQDVSLAKEIHRHENRVNSMELGLKKDCENIIALYNPVASDLRLVLAVLNIVTNLERIGDHADKIARYVRKQIITDSYEDALLDEIGFAEMFETANEMVDRAILGFHEEDSEIARGVFNMDDIINEINQKSPKIIAKYLKSHPEKSTMLLFLFSILNKLERVGDLAKNISEETIFYIEAEIFLHKKKKNPQSK